MCTAIRNMMKYKEEQDRGKQPDGGTKHDSFLHHPKAQFLWILALQKLHPLPVSEPPIVDGACTRPSSPFSAIYFPLSIRYMLDKCCTTRVCCNDFHFSSISQKTVLNKSLVKLLSTSVLIFIYRPYNKSWTLPKEWELCANKTQLIHQFDSPQTVPQTHHDQIASATKGEKDKWIP
jgi:hypothetical protein